ncbi:hypothetical protein Cgig2_016803 [Carnegiea gigantea]|uniref:Uncharacterized protein n=1 Tax=Carnegiea gigantea TaxID=171969 RepID=A0A9Q1GZ76_9CARY|nr:hypothetical protein Cgig2_016803 [Carnegiea gigantea]
MRSKTLAMTPASSLKEITIQKARMQQPQLAALPFVIVQANDPFAVVFEGSERSPSKSYSLLSCPSSALLSFTPSSDTSFAKTLLFFSSAPKNQTNWVKQSAFLSTSPALLDHTLPVPPSSSDTARTPFEQLLSLPVNGDISDFLSCLTCLLSRFMMTSGSVSFPAIASTGSGASSTLSSNDFLDPLCAHRGLATDSPNLLAHLGLETAESPNLLAHLGLAAADSDKPAPKNLFPFKKDGVLTTSSISSSGSVDTGNGVDLASSLNPTISIIKNTWRTQIKEFSKFSGNKGKETIKEKQGYEGPFKDGIDHKVGKLA